ncbi:OB-fold protein [Bordetella petrii]|uniref:OB-fold protein n=1 Tax=Bordetella petrii TaxID=94624 RepID=UPI00372E7114
MRIVFLAAILVSFFSSQAHAQYKPSQSEIEIVTYLTMDDTIAFSQGQESLTGRLAQIDESLTVNDVVKAYRANEVAGDRKYFGKRLVLVGTVDAIKSGIGNTPYLVFKGDRLLNPQAILDSNAAERAAQLSRGAKVGLVCEGAGSIAGTPMFRNCRFAIDVASEVLGALAIETDRFFAGEGVSDDAANFGVSVIALASLVDPAADCSENFKACQAAVGKVSRNAKALEEARTAAIEKLRAHGISYSPTIDDKGH